MPDAMQPATGPAVWTGRELRQTDDWKIRLTPEDVAELESASAAVARKNIPVQTITAGDFPLPGLGLRLETLAEELENGRGFGVIRGIPVDDTAEDACKIVSWGICSYLGAGIPQSRQGDWINHVIDLTDVKSTTNPDLLHVIERAELRTNHVGGDLTWHTDTTDIIALFCLNKAKAGGATRLASSAAVHNLILAETPEYLSALYDGYYYMSRADDNQNDTPRVSSERVPVFRRKGDSVTCYYIPQVVQRAIDRANVAYSPVENEAREQIQKAANTPGVPLEITLEPGDLLVVNNRIVLHGRQDYEDFPELERRRHLLRLWMAVTPEMASETFRAPSDRFSR